MLKVLWKIYAGFCPADEAGFNALAQAGKDALGNEEPWLFLEKDLIRISFEGMYFPLEEILETLAAHLPPTALGKLDCIDLEAWRLTRYEFCNGGFTKSTRSLNHVLDYSGH